MPQPLITIARARGLVLACATVLGTERVAVATALDRVLAADVTAAAAAPPFPASAMDGYAIHAGPAGRELAVVGESRAGAPAGRDPADGEAIRISTGAVVPDGATAVIRQEDVEARPESILTTADVSPGANIRPAGDVMAAGASVLAAGTRLDAAALAAAVGAGAGQVSVFGRPRVRVACTGDELRAPGEPLGPGQIHNSNGPMLAALTSRAGAAAPAATLLADDRERTRAWLDEALAAADVVIVSGGVSVGPHDHVKPALAELGIEEVFWGVSLQPGKPTWFGARGETLVFGLPGNPVSAAVTFSLFVWPALAAMQGTSPRPVAPPTAPLGAPVARNRRREQALRVRLEHADSGIAAVPNGPQGSHVITSLVGADALAMIPAGEGALETGELVTLEPLLH